jgi:two-component system LytT family response regulator
MKLKVLLIDDEPPARKKLRHFLRDEPQVVIVGEAKDGLEGLRAIEDLRPDLIFLDVQMPRMNGFEMLEELREWRPQIIFTTAYDQYALRAFEVRALDYLLKPFDQERFQQALTRALENRSQSSRANEQIDDLLREMQKKQGYIRRLLLRVNGRIVFIKVSQIEWIEAQEKYVSLHVGNETYLHRETMNSLEERLDPAQLIRIHRSQIVNIEFVKELQAWSHGDYLVVLKNGTRLPLGRRYKEKFLRAFEKAR